MDPLYEFALAVKAIHRELERGTNQAMEAIGLTGAQADALYVLGQTEPVSLRELGGLLIAEAGHPSRLVDRLVKAGLVERHPAADDRRRVELTLSAKGRRLEKKIHSARAEIFGIAREAIGDRDLRSTVDVLRDLAQLTSYGELIARRRELEDGDRD